MSKQYKLIQKIVANGEDVDLSFLRAATYIEAITLNNPNLIIKIDDVQRYFRDDLGVKEGDTLNVSIEDPYNSDSLSYKADWVVLSMPIHTDEIITLNLIPKTLFELKAKQTKAQAFIQKKPIDILNKLAGMTVQCGKFHFKNDYYLANAQEISKLFSLLAREHGALVFCRRDELVFDSFAELFKKKEVREYYHNDTRKDFQISTFKVHKDAFLLRELLDRQYVGWSLNDGWMASTRYSDKAIKFTSASQKYVLDNLSKSWRHVVEIEMLGDGALRVGDVIKTNWIRSSIESPLDESLPEKMLIVHVSHAYINGKYSTLCKCALENKEDDE